jgi:hypothetical protein
MCFQGVKWLGVEEILRKIGVQSDLGRFFAWTNT